MLRRYSAAGFAASLVTLTMLFVMTQLISPVGGDPVVREMLLQLEFQQRSPPDRESGIRVFELPPRPGARSAPDAPPEVNGRPERPERGEYSDDPDDNERSRVIDWWAEARAAIKDVGDAEFEDWLEAQGSRRYVSIMRGAVPTGGSRATRSAQDTAENRYQNLYGDVEIAISENCVLQMRPRHFDSSDFARNIPPLVVCKPAPGENLPELEDYLNNRPKR